MITIILKGTNGCNLACNYCSLGKKDHAILPDSTMIFNIMDYACQLGKHNNDNSITFILHGGEPTLVKVSTYDEAISRIKAKYSDMDITISIQTNGYHINDEWISFFKKYDISVGISLDGSKSIHDKERLSASGVPTFDVITRNIDTLLANDIHVSCLMVLTSIGLSEDFGYLEYYSKHDLHLKINPLLDFGEVYEHPELSLKQGEYATYIIKLYEHILNNDLDITVSPIDKLLLGIINNETIHECTFRKNCNKNFLCIDYKGDMYPCGRFADLKEYYLGNILDCNYDIFADDIINELVARRTKLLPNKCRECKYVSLCNAGCNADCSIYNSPDKTPAMCKDYMILFEYFTNKGLYFLKEKLLERKTDLTKILKE